jgi:hypothetical protein
MADMTRYDFYADMYATHSEIGYLLWLVLMLLLSDGALALALAWWPQSDVYLVPGISGYAQVPVIWGATVPHAVPGTPASGTLMQVDLERLQRPGAGSPASAAVVVDGVGAGTTPTTFSSASASSDPGADGLRDDANTGAR